MDRRGFLKFGGALTAVALVAPHLVKVFQENDSIKVIPFSNAFAEGQDTPMRTINFSKCKSQNEVNRICRKGDMGLGRDGNHYYYMGDGKWIPIDASVKSIINS